MENEFYIWHTDVSSAVRLAPNQVEDISTNCKFPNRLKTLSIISTNLLITNCEDQ